VRDAGHPPWPPVLGGLADPGRVEADRLHTACGDLALERRTEVETGSEPGDHEQRWPGSAYRGAYPDPVGVHEPEGAAVR
jgi:hypothetical protein